MKKVFALLIAIALMFSLAGAEDIDLSSLSFDELVILVNNAQLEMMKKDEWQEVEVPIGTYLIGQDIPAGKWTISCNENYYLYLEVGKKPKENGSIDMLADIDSYINCFLYGPKYSLYDEGNATFISLDLKEGQYIHIDSGSAYFTPFKGNSFSFK